MRQMIVKAPIYSISRLRFGTDGKGITSLVAFMGCPLGMTAKNGTPGGSFCVGGSGGRTEGKTRHSGLYVAFSGVPGGCLRHHFANVGNMVGVVGLLGVRVWL